MTIRQNRDEDLPAVYIVRLFETLMIASFGRIVFWLVDVVRWRLGRSRRDVDIARSLGIVVGEAGSAG